MTTPARFRAKCDLCGLELDTRTEGVHQWTKGWVMQRRGGGGHGISLAERDPRWAHQHCVDRAKRGAGQLDLLDNSPPSPSPSPSEPPPPSNARLDDNGHLIHETCAVDGCTRAPGNGVGVNLAKGHLGLWYCYQHWPHRVK